MEKMNGTSMDLLGKNIEIIEKLFPEVMTEEEFNGKVERKIDFDKLRLLLGDDVSDREERYELRWNGKNDAIRFAQTPSNGTLRPDKESSKNWDDTENLYIEGDNLEVLKLLKKSYFGKIKMIYIDPPYNTGKDFVYKDDFRDNVKNYLEQTRQNTTTNTENDGRYHTNWMNMMYPRLKLARNLLKDDGVIFISIDDNEVFNLKKLCDEIFGEDNFVAMVSVIVKTEGRRYGDFAKTHEQILIYSKNHDEIKLNEIEIEGKDFSYMDEFGGFNIKDLRNQNARAFNKTNRPNLRYPFYVDTNEIDENGFCKINTKSKEGYEEVYPITVNEYKSVWRWGKDKATKEINNLTARKGSDGIVRIYQKYRKLTQTPKTVWFEKEFISNKGTKEIQAIMGNGIFDFPKPINLMRRVLEIGLNNDSIVMDFFSGSATTAHAVMQLNAEDGGNRKFIMVQLPEITPEKSEARKAGYENICEIGKERIRRAGDMIVNENKDKEGIEDLDIGFKVFKLDSSNIKEWDPDYENLEYSLFERQDIIKMGRTNEDLLYEIIIKMGIEPTVGIEEIKFGEKIIYNIGMGALLICLEDEITEDLVAEIPNHKSIIDEMDTKVVFKESGFRTDSAKMNAIQKLKQFGITDVRSV